MNPVSLSTTMIDLYQAPPQGEKPKRPPGWRWFYKGEELITDVGDVRLLNSDQLFAFDIEITTAEAKAAEWLDSPETLDRGRRLERAARKYRSALQVTRSSLQNVDRSHELEATKWRIAVDQRDQRIEEIAREKLAIQRELEDVKDRLQELIVQNNELRDMVNVAEAHAQKFGKGGHQ